MAPERHNESGKSNAPREKSLNKIPNKFNMWYLTMHYLTLNEYIYIYIYVAIIFLAFVP